VLGLQKIEFPNKYPDFVRDDIPHELHDLIRQLLSLNPRRRPSIDDILDQWSLHGSFKASLNPSEGTDSQNTPKKPQITKIPSDVDIAQTMSRKLDQRKRRSEKYRFDDIRANASDDTESDSDDSCRTKLLLPPVRETTLSMILNFIKILTNAKMFIAIAKVASSMVICHPFSPNPFIFYPILLCTLSDFYL
ncbi:putative serine/threonine-protein kinase iks1, partial [Basidiobolus ranarum]